MPNFTFRVPYHPDVTEQEMQHTAELWVDAEQRAAERHQQAVRTFVATLEERHRELRNLLGAENHFALQQLKQELDLEAIRRLKPPHGLGISRADVGRTHTQQVTQFLSQRGIQPEVVRATVQRLFEGMSLRSDAHVTGVMQVTELSKPPLLSPWESFTPPFRGYGLGYSEGTVGYRLERQYLTHPAAGQVGLILTMDDRAAGESDYGFMYYSSTIAFWFRAPATGLVAVIIEAQCGEARHELQVRDRFGFSSSSTTQRNLLLMKVIHVNVREPVYNLASEFHYSGGGDVSLNEQYVLPGQTVQSDTLISDGPIPAGATVLIAAGCQSEDDSNANDKDVYSRSAFSWFIKRVQVRILD
jgi:hypothetical protein